MKSTPRFLFIYLVTQGAEWQRNSLTKMKKLFFLAVTVCTILSSCSSPEEVPEPTPQPTPEAEAKIPINLSIGNAVRANDETFEANDEVGVYVVNYTDGTAGTLAPAGNQADNMRFTYIDNAWTPDEAIYWKDDSTPADIIVYYPYDENLSSITAYPFSVQTDQSSADNFWASDFLWGKATGISPTFSAVPVTTNHSLSRIILNLQRGEGYTAEDWAAAEKSVSITNVKTSATIDISTGIATATGEATNVTPLMVSEGDNTICYHAMMIPQEITSYATLIKVTINGKVYTITKSITLKPRTQHGFNLKADRVTGELKLSIGEWETEYAELSNEITYTTTDGKALELPDWGYYDDVDIFGANITSNTYSNGQGVITFDGGISKIGENAFENCSNLSSIIIPDGVTQIGYRAFYGCSNLSSIDLPAGLTQIGDYAFHGCSSLTSINIPDSVTQIGEGAFAGCSSLTSINIPDSVTQIGDYAFYGCSYLTSINIPAGVTQIGYGVFAGCSSFTSINIPDSVTQIGDYAFYGCSYLTSINIPAGGTQIGKSAFAGCSSLTSINIPAGVTQIGESAFEGCSNLTSIDIPDSVTQIAERAFYDCSSLTSIDFPEGVTQIGDSAFSRSGLTNIVLPASIERIYRAFYGCNKLTTFGCKAVNPPFFGTQMFNSCDKLAIINVPAASIDAYKAADGWKDYADIIVGYDFTE